MRRILASTLLISLSVTFVPPEAIAQEAAPATGTPEPAAPPPRVRDPLWPVGYVPKKNLPPPPVAVAPEKPAPKPLTEAELEELVKREQERIRTMIAVNGKIVRGSKWYVFINRDLLVTEGDVLEVDVDGVFYRLVIKSLSENNIQLEPYRQNKAK